MGMECEDKENPCDYNTIMHPKLMQLGILELNLRAGLTCA